MVQRRRRRRSERKKGREEKAEEVIMMEEKRKKGKKKGGGGGRRRKRKRKRKRRGRGRGGRQMKERKRKKNRERFSHICRLFQPPTCGTHRFLDRFEKNVTGQSIESLTWGRKKTRASIILFSAIYRFKKSLLVVGLHNAPAR